MKRKDLEYTDCQEFTPLPDEFLQHSTVLEQTKGSKKKIKKMIGMVLSFSVLVLMVMNQPVSTPVQPQEPENQQTKLQEPIQQEPVQEEISYPMDSGTVTFTIYSETIDPNTLDNQILATKTMPIEKFKDGYVYQMPSSPEANGDIFMDWVIFKNNKQ